MKQDILQEDLKYLLSEDTYEIDVHLGQQHSNSVYINTMTLFKKHELIEVDQIRNYLRPRFENGQGQALHDEYQILSNMPNVNIPLEIDGRKISVTRDNGQRENYMRSSEHLYQALRFPDDAHGYQMETLEQGSSMGAKRKAKRIDCRPFHKDCFQDFDAKNPNEDLDAALEVMRIMYQTLRIKLAYKQRMGKGKEAENFGRTLYRTGNKTIIEIAPKQSGGVDTFWGTKIESNGTLSGRNVMGKLLMYLRENFKEDLENQRQDTRTIDIPGNLELNLLGSKITRIEI